MSDIKLFKLEAQGVTQLPASSVALEKSLQTLMEDNLEALMGIRFLASEYWTGPKHNGRIDSLGLDENGCPVIIEYKRATNQNVMNQGLYYLDWLLDHQAEFKLLVLEKFGQEDANGLHWPGVRLVCVAGDYTKFDLHAVQQINRNIELFRYGRYGDELLLLDLVNARQEARESAPAGAAARKQAKSKKKAQHRAAIDDLEAALREYLTSLGDDVQEKPLKLYTAYKRIKNFVCTHRDQRHIRAWVKLSPDSIDLEDGFSRDVRQIGHWGTGDLELSLKTLGDLEKARPLLLRSYDEN